MATPSLSGRRAEALRNDELMLQALRAPGAGPLPGPPPAWGEIQRRWTD